MMNQNLKKIAKITLCAFVVTSLGYTSFSIALADDSAELKNLMRTERAYESAWQRAPLSVSTITFIKEPAAYFGQYEPRGNSIFSVEEELIVYIEPIGYGFGREDENFTIDISVGMELHTTDGKVLVSTATSEHFGLQSKVQNKEFQVSVSYQFQELPAGKYKLVLNLEDQNSTKSGSFALPFEVKE